MKRKYSKKPLKQKQIALERIQILFEQAGKRFKKDPFLSNRYVSLARKIAMKYKVKIPSELKKQFCKHCYKYLVPSVNCRVRLQKGKVVYYCLNCKKYMRFPYRKKKA
jgi:ribonuclease P protein subunit RPR2